MSNVFITPSASTISRDQIIDVTVTVDISNYSGTLNLELSQGAKTKILGNRGSVKIYDFGSGASNPYCTDNTSINCVTITPPSASATFKFVYNSTGTIKIKATDSNNCAIFGESTAISVNYQIRKYTEKFSNPTVNNYDSIISSEVNTWSDWKIPPASPYAFISGASPEIDLIKAIAFKESSLKSTNEPNLMQLTSAALNGMGGEW
ncbi:MAG: hypothetical protein JXR73_04210 [Candidatus Omnitrophica bacterium]|nr:hypothetical protein [Candidatus Omnitrophota bacterium]